MVAGRCSHVSPPYQTAYRADCFSIEGLWFYKSVLFPTVGSVPPAAQVIDQWPLVVKGRQWHLEKQSCELETWHFFFLETTLQSFNIWTKQLVVWFLDVHPQMCKYQKLCNNSCGWKACRCSDYSGSVGWSAQQNVLSEQKSNFDLLAQVLFYFSSMFESKWKHPCMSYYYVPVCRFPEDESRNTGCESTPTSQSLLTIDLSSVRTCNACDTLSCTFVLKNVWLMLFTGMQMSDLR